LTTWRVQDPVRTGANAIYQGQRTQGAASFQSSTEFLKLIPEAEVQLEYFEVENRRCKDRTMGEIASLAVGVMFAGAVTGILAGLLGVGGGAIIVPSCSRSSDFLGFLRPCACNYASVPR
jgi:hypothetical protein